jgi:hypothetical protein
MKFTISIDESSRSANGLARVIVQSESIAGDYELDISFEKFYPALGAPDEQSLNLLFVSSVCYVIDKITARKNKTDGWTRDLEVEIPVSQITLWKKTSRIFNEMLGFLTGDNWNVKFIKRTETLFKVPPEKRRSTKKPLNLDGFTGAGTFSGGADSLIGAIDLLTGNPKEKLLLVGHHDESGPMSAQRRLYSAISEEYPARTELLQVRVGHKPSSANERSSRSRSFLFISIAVYAARAIGKDVPVHIPENGFIALNMPLTPSRSSACSTRTMHPYFLGKVRELLTELNIHNPLINRLGSQTKGECVANCENLKLLSGVINESVSCSSPTRQQRWKRRGDKIRNCGHCVPCIIRRSSLHKAGLDDGKSYGFDICDGELKIDDDLISANDLRAIVSIIRQNLKVEDYARILLGAAPLDELDEKTGLISRGIDEIKVLFREKGEKALLDAAKITPVKK